jgi:Zn-finger nucleic acid-binding protein
MQCPGCHATLRTVDYEGIKIESCPACEGEWLDAGELKHIAQAREVRFDEAERRAVAAAVKITPVKVERHDRDLRCPKCAGQTDARNYGGDTGILIDQCTTCGGIWVDVGELEKIQMVIEGWEDGLPEDLRKYGPRLRQVAEDTRERTCFKESRFAFLNAIINGILDVGL